MKSTLKYLSMAILIPASIWAGTLTGTVTAASGGAAIANASVVIRQGSTTAAVYDSVRTSATGTYTFTVLPAATYYVTTSATGYVAISNRSVTVTANGTATSNFALTAMVGTITGVARSAGSPVPGLVVTLRRGSATSDAIATATTDSTGRYTFSNVPSGTPNYYVTIFNPATNQSLTNGNLSVTNGGTVTSNFVLSPTAIQAFSRSHGIKWAQSGDHLTLDLGVSGTARTVSVVSLNGSIQYRATIAAGESHTTIPATFAKGFIFQVR
jgi:hypothetical protein